MVDTAENNADSTAKAPVRRKMDMRVTSINCKGVAKKTTLRSYPLCRSQQSRLANP
jgi:hypothetical protein